MTFSALTITELLSRFSDGTPTPGGGSAAALSSAVGASLVAMVARVTAKGKKYADRAEEMEKIAAKADMLSARLLQLVTDDSASYDAVSAAYKLPKETDDDKAARSEAIQSAMKVAAFTPMMTLEASLSALALAAEVVERGNPNCVTDAAMAALMCETGMQGAMMNIAINLGSIKDDVFNANAEATMHKARSASKAYLLRVNAVHEIDRCFCDDSKESEQ